MATTFRRFGTRTAPSSHGPSALIGPSSHAEPPVGWLDIHRGERGQVPLVGRPGLEPGTLGLKERFRRSKWSRGDGWARDCIDRGRVVSDWSGNAGPERGTSGGMLRALSRDWLR